MESAFSHLELLEKYGFYDTCVSMKSSTVPTMVAAARLFREKCDYVLENYGTQEDFQRICQEFLEKLMSKEENPYEY